MERGVETRIDQVEKSIGNLEEVIASMMLDQEQRMTALKMGQEQRLTRLEALLTSLVKGKAHMDDAEASTRLATKGTHSNTLPIQQTVIVEANALAIKKVEMPNFDGVHPIGWLARADQYFVLNNTIVSPSVWKDQFFTG